MEKGEQLKSLRAIPDRLLLGAGPSNPDPRVLSAMSSPMVSHLDPYFLALMDDTQEMLRRVFGTRNALTLPVAGTGSAAMETAVMNALEPGEGVIVCIGGYFGHRLADMARRCGAVVHEVVKEPGQAFSLADVRTALSRHRGAKALALVHVETSTGVLQPLKAIGELVREAGMYYIVDAVTSLGGTPVEVDRNGIDICYSCSQKCLASPPGLAPITVSGRMMEAIAHRHSPVLSWYLDLALLAEYWGGTRTYHHTAPISMNYALNAALDLIMEEGLSNGFARHQDTSVWTLGALREMGFTSFPEEGYEASMLLAVEPPSGVSVEQLRKSLLKEHAIEVSGGLGPLAGRIVRIGLMGSNANTEAAERLVSAVRQILGV